MWPPSACNLDGSELEAVAPISATTTKLRRFFGTLWQSDNDDDGNRGVRILYVMEFGNFGFTDG